jgi:hypothetical protein
VNRRQFLRAVGFAGASAGLPAGTAVDPDGFRPGSDSPSTSTETPTPAGTPTATPTEAVATPTAGWEPLGRVAIHGATETVVTPDGGTAFVAVGEGFATVDLSDPGDPSVLRRVTDVSPPGTDRVMAGIQDVKYDDGELLVAGPANYHPDAFRGVVRYDVTDPAAPELLGAHETVFPVHNCYFADGYAYLTGNDDERNPLVVVDVTAPAELARWSVIDHDEGWADIEPGLRTLHDVWVQDGLAYLAYWDAGTWILDVSDPTDPAYVGHVSDHTVEDLRAKRGLAVHRERLEPPGNAHYVQPGDEGALMAVGKETWNSNAGLDGTTPGPDDPGGPSGIDLYDVADPSDPTRLATIDPPPTADPNIAGVWTTAHNLDLHGGYLYSSWYQGGVKVHDISDPADPEEVRYFRRPSAASFWTAQLAVPGEMVVASSRFDPPDVPAALYTFPDVSRASTTTGIENGTDVETSAGPPSSPSPSPSPTRASVSNSPSPTSSTGGMTPAAPDDTTDATTDRTDAGGPGFGPLAALAGLGVGAWRLLDGDPDDCDDGP